LVKTHNNGGNALFPIPTAAEIPKAAE